ncbi:MAG: vanadium-dependent haloperoxidase [Gemmatimonadaceae bacterium]
MTSTFEEDPHMSSSTQLVRSAALVASIVVISACSADPTSTDAGVSEPPPSPVYTAGGVPIPEASAALNAVLAGNAQAVAAAPSLVPPGVPLAPFVEARLYAISNVAMHDALNAIVPRFERYADTGHLDHHADLTAAVLTAARDAIVGADPGASESTNAWYASAIASVSGASGFAEGVAIGQRSAAAILARRAADGTAGGGVGPYVPGSHPGDYRFTFPFNTPGFDFFGTGGFADANLWGTTVTPFVVTSTSQFRAPHPYGAPSNAAAVQTARYTHDYNEVAALGCAGCLTRTAAQTEIALFWMENSPTGWNRIARTIADQRDLDAWDTARMLALLQMGEFDAYSTSLESKYYYNFWRPVTAVALAGSDGNPDTSPIGGWEVLAFPTPPVPDYPSAHAGAGGAAAAIIEAILPVNGPAFSTSSGSLPGVTRSFLTVADAAKENDESRVYIGYHFRFATEAGETQGRKVGSYVADNALRAIHGSK